MTKVVGFATGYHFKDREEPALYLYKTPSIDLYVVFPSATVTDASCLEVVNA